MEIDAGSAPGGKFRLSLPGAPPGASAGAAGATGGFGFRMSLPSALGSSTAATTDTDSGSIQMLDGSDAAAIASNSVSVSAGGGASLSAYDRVPLDKSFEISDAGTLIIRNGAIEINRKGVSTPLKAPAGAATDTSPPSANHKSSAADSKRTPPTAYSKLSAAAAPKTPPLVATAAPSSAAAAAAAAAAASTPSSSSRLPGTPPMKQLIELSPDDLIETGTLGKGACGVVKKALHLPTLTFVGLKSIGVFDRSTRHQLMRELNELTATSDPASPSTPTTPLALPNANASAAAAAAAAVASPNATAAAAASATPSTTNGSAYLVGFSGAFFENSSTHIALEYMNRGSLHDLVTQFGALKEDVLASIARQICCGLDHMHTRHKIHRDLKPANVLVNHSGDVKLTDFGIVAELTDTAAKCTTFVGTHLYMSPERISSNAYSYGADVWALGMTLYFCATGKNPITTADGFFGIAAAISKNPAPALSTTTFSGACASFVANCLIKDESKRPTVKQLLTHPFVSKPAVITAAKWPFPGGGSKLEAADLDVILNHLIARHYPKGTKYNKSLFDLARFQKIGVALGFDPKVVQKQFEERIAKQK